MVHWRHSFPANTNPCSPCTIPVEIANWGDSVNDAPISIVVPDHGYPAGDLDSPQVILLELATGNLVLPGADSIDTTLYQVAYVAESAINSVLLSGFHVSQWERLPWRSFPNANFNVGAYNWLHNDGSVRDDLTSSTRLWYTHPSDNTLVSYFYFLFLATGGGGGGTDTREEMRVSEYEASLNIPADVAINMNAATPGWTVGINIAQNYTAHDSRNAASFDEFYPRYLEATVEGFVLSQKKISRNDADPAGWIRIGREIIAGSRITFKTTLQVIV